MWNVPLDALTQKLGRETVRNGWHRAYPPYKCYFRCSVVSLCSRLCCWVPSMRTIKMHCSLYMDGITSVSTILFLKRQSPGSTTLNTKQFLLIWSIFVFYIVLSACHSEAVLITKGLLPEPHGIALQFGLKH